MKKKQLLVAVCIISILAIAFFWGGNNKKVEPLSFNQTEQTSDLNEVVKPDKVINLGIKNSEGKDLESKNLDNLEKEDTKKEDTKKEDIVPQEKPKPLEEQNVSVSKESDELSCVLSITCKSILNNMHLFDMDKIEIVPEDGAIYATQTVTFYEGESVFDVLLREMKQNKIHMEFVKTPIHNSNYIEGINNLYEFDCGELSGWMYKVNDWFPNYGSSRYMLKDGDVIEWLYTCDFGRDIGGEEAAKEGQR